MIRSSQEFLLQCNKYIELTSYHCIPDDLKSSQGEATQSKKIWRHGKRGGSQERLKRLGNKLSLPMTLLINAQSLRGKMEELIANLRYLHEYKNACVLAITEMWLNENVPSSEVEPTGFTVF